jgi:adenosylhomocysteine nucleosidase
MPLLRLLLCLLALSPAVAHAASHTIDPTPRIALFSAYQPEWDALLKVVEQPVSHPENGIDFVTGRIEGHDVVLVLTGVSMVNAALSAQMAIDRFDLRAILFSGIAGGVDPSLDIGDVVVAERWGQYLDVIMARETPQGFRLPPWAKQEFPNYGMIFSRGVQVAHPGEAKPVCLVHAPKVVVGGNGVSGTAFVDNAAFRKYVFATFKAQVLDMESAAVAHVASMNGVPYLAFRSLSDLAGGGPGENEEHTFEHLAAANSVAVLRAFLKALPE